MNHKSKLVWLCRLTGLLLIGCQPVILTTPATIQSSPTSTRTPTRLVTTQVPTETATPTATPKPSTLTICMGAEPDTLFIYGAQMYAQSLILAAIYDGPVDERGFNYQAVILRKLPSLADGDAVIEPIEVRGGEWVINDSGEKVRLTKGVKVRPYGCNQPGCAIIWEGSPLNMAQLSVVYTLREGIKWSDGLPLTAHDSVFSFQVARQCLTNDLCYAPKVDLVASYTTLDKYSARWVGLPGYLEPDYQTLFITPLPKHATGHLTIAEMLEDKQTIQYPMGWGAYSIQKYEYGNYIRLSKNLHYFREAEGLPYFDYLIFRFIGNQPDQVLEEIQAGRCDILDQEASYGIPYDQLLELDASGKIQAHFSIGTVWEHLDFSIGHSDYDDGYQAGSDRPDLFGDVRTRQAIAMCLDREKINEQVFFGLSEVLHSYLPQAHPLYNPNIHHYAFDVSAATALLEEVGWLDHDNDPSTPRRARNIPRVPNGTPLEFSYRTTTATYRQQVTQILADSLAQCGIKVNLEYLEAAQFFADPPKGDLFSRRFDVAEFAWLVGTQPPCELFTTSNIPGDPSAINPDGSPRFPAGLYGQNNSGFSNQEYDQVCLASQELLPGLTGYIENHYKAQEIFAVELPVVPLFARIKVAITRPDMCGFALDPTSSSDLWNIETLGYGAGCP